MLLKKNKKKEGRDEQELSRSVLLKFYVQFRHEEFEQTLFLVKIIKGKEVPNFEKFLYHVLFNDLFNFKLSVRFMFCKIIVQVVHLLM